MCHFIIIYFQFLFLVYFSTTLLLYFLFPLLFTCCVFNVRFCTFSLVNAFYLFILSLFPYNCEVLINIFILCLFNMVIQYFNENFEIKQVQYSILFLLPRLVTALCNCFWFKRSWWHVNMTCCRDPLTCFPSTTCN